MTQDALFPMPVRRGKNGHPRVRCPGGCLFHALLPSMAYACGPYLTTPGHDVTGANDDEWAKVTCPECRAVGQDTVRAIYAKHRGSA